MNISILKIASKILTFARIKKEKKKGEHHISTYISPDPPKNLEESLTFYA